ncbi:unnamed protein product [Cutaneotrichosporon oleaginosum]
MSTSPGFPSEAEAKAGIGSYGVSCTLAGIMLDVFFFGVFVAQLVSYCNSKFKDPTWVKCLVGAVVVMATVSSSTASFVLANAGYNWWIASRWFVYNYGRYTIFLHTGPIAWLALIDAVNMGLCQIFFAYRAYRLWSRNVIIPIGVGLCILTCLASTIAIVVMYIPLTSILDTHYIVPVALTWHATNMLADIIITATILRALVKIRTGIASTDKLIARLIRMTLESQAAAATIAMTLLVDTIVEPSNLLGISILLFQSKVYVVGFFYSLNLRSKSERGENITMNDTHPLAFSHEQAATIVIEQQTEMHIMHVNPPPSPGLNRKPGSQDQSDTDVVDINSQSSATAYSSSSVKAEVTCLENV